MSDEFVENMNEYFGVRMDMEFIRIGKENSSDYEKQRTATLRSPLVGNKEIRLLKFGKKEQKALLLLWKF
ncbi:Hypothetical predicted protein [Octopus vulgaris]|uniref:Uncharacterized protein n=1 Tax=Octopus vulgaris TaxID=6645 RepID=A0AA36F1S4_OCTVU|nr:Hypothetical predicted protein [Octopus vulgaris]